MSQLPDLIGDYTALQIMADIFAILEGPPQGEHYHRCPREECGHIWLHDTRDIRTDAEYATAHTCPQCKDGTNYRKCRKDGTEL
jgi:hypothetical protein